MSKAHLFVNDISNFAELDSNPASVLIWMSQITAELEPEVDYKYKSSASINGSSLWESNCVLHIFYISKICDKLIRTDGAWDIDIHVHIYFPWRDGC